MSLGRDFKPRCLCVRISTRAKLTHTRQRSCSPCQSSVDYGNAQITQHALKSVGIFQILKLDTMRKKQKLDTMRKKQKKRERKTGGEKKKAQPLCGSDWMTLDQLLNFYFPFLKKETIQKQTSISASICISPCSLSAELRI